MTDAVLAWRAEALRCAASAQLHAIEYYRREQLAMKKWRASACATTADELLELLLALLSSSAVFDNVTQCLSLFPWAAFLLRFVERSRLRDATVLQLRIDASLRDVLPWNVCCGKLLRLRSLLSRLVARLTSPAPPLRSAEELTEQLAATLRARECLLSLDAAFVGCVARQYDLVANELRWLALPDVLQRTLKYTSVHAEFELCDAWQPSALKALVLLCSARTVPSTAVLLDAHIREVRTRLLVQLFECAAHYIAVRGCEFVQQAATSLLTASTAVKALLPLFADLLRTPIAVVDCETPAFIVHPTSFTRETQQPTVLLERQEGVWHVARLCDAAAAESFVEREWCLSTPASLALAQLLRMPSTNDETRLHGANECTIDALLRLVGGEKNTYFNDVAIRDLLRLVTRDCAGVACFEPLSVDTSTPVARENFAKAAEKARSAVRNAQMLLVPWNNRSGHWALLCLDWPTQTARYFDSLNSLDQPSELPSVCKMFFGDMWTGAVQTVRSPQQDDAHSCGAYMLLNAWHVARARPLPPKYPRGAVLRDRLAKAWLDNVLPAHFDSR
jgi:hypothetical protein